LFWAAILGGLLVIQFQIGHGLPSGKNAAGAAMSPFALVAFSEVIIATAIRWLWLPRLMLARQQLVAMIIGLALAEGSNFMGLFLVPADQPETKLLIFVLAVLGVLQFAPIYARDA
jgi:hypothetical protein